MQATRTSFIPLLVSAHSDRIDPAAVRDEVFAGLSVVYTAGPDFGRRVVTHNDLSQLAMPPQALRQTAFQHLEVLSSRAEFHGQPPALMLSFEGLESSLLLAGELWARLEGAVPGELIVGVPARDVVVVTGSRSGPGLEKAKRCVERVFFAGGDNLIHRGLLVRRGNGWEPFDRTVRPSGRPVFGPAHMPGVGQPPRQFQEHPSWPGERIPPQAPVGHRPGAPGRPGPVRRRPMYDVPPSALEQTGSHRLDQTGPHRFGGPRFDQTGSQPRFDQTGSQPRLDQTGSHPRFDQTGSHRLEHTGSHRLDETGSHRLDQTGSHRLGVTGQQPPVSALTGQTLPASRRAEQPPPYPAAAYEEFAREDSYGDDSSLHAIAPQSVAPNALATQMSPTPYGAATWRDEPGYARDDHPTGTKPMLSVREREPVSTPSYPSSWGSGPESSSSKIEFRTGPRARFS